MKGMRVGGYKEKSGETPLINLSTEVQDTSGEGVVEQETIETPEVIEAAETPEQEEQVVESFQDYDENEPYEVIEEAATKPAASNTVNQEGVSGNPEGETVKQEPVVSEPAEISEELLLKRLSEKLGRDITSFEELAETGDKYEDPYLKGLSEWREKTNRPIEDWIKFNQDFTQLPDVEIAREFLQIEYPELSQEEIDLELNTKFVASEDEDTDREMALKNLELKKYASRGRKELDKIKVQFGEPNLDNFTPEVKESLELAARVKQNAAKEEVDNRNYLQAINSKADTLKTIKMELGEGLDMDYKLPQNSNKSLVKMVQEAPHWKNSDGSWNHEAVVRDAAIIANFQDMLKVAYEQGKNSGVDEVIRDTKNTTLGNRTSNDSALPTGNRGVQIEGLDRYLGKTGMRIRKRN